MIDTSGDPILLVCKGYEPRRKVVAWSNSSMSLASSRRVARKTRATEDAGNWRCRIHICLWRHLEGLHAKLVPRKMRATSDDSKADG